MRPTRRNLSLALGAMATRSQGIQQVVESITTLALIDSRELYGRKSAAEPRAGLGERGAGLGRRPQGPPPHRALHEGSRPPVRALPCLQATPATHGISELALEPSRPPLTPPEVPSLGHTTASHDGHSGLALAPTTVTLSPNFTPDACPQRVSAASGLFHSPGCSGHSGMATPCLRRAVLAAHLSARAMGSEGRRPTGDTPEAARSGHPPLTRPGGLRSALPC